MFDAGHELLVQIKTQLECSHADCPTCQMEKYVGHRKGRSMNSLVFRSSMSAVT